MILLYDSLPYGFGYTDITVTPNGLLYIIGSFINTTVISDSIYIYYPDIDRMFLSTVKINSPTGAFLCSSHYNYLTDSIWVFESNRIWQSNTLTFYPTDSPTSITSNPTNNPTIQPSTETNVL